MVCSAKRSAVNGVSAGFEPVSGDAATVLILGTLPGRISLLRGEYYAQSRNAFWRIMGDLFGAGPQLPYAERTRRLIERRIAVWDVCASAERRGSLDSAIDAKSVVVNDFPAFLSTQRNIEMIAFNGAVAQALYNSRVRPDLAAGPRHIGQLRLPSTSPAHAAITYERKLAAWSAIRRRRGGRE